MPTKIHLVSWLCPNAIIYEKPTRNHFRAKLSFTPKKRYILRERKKLHTHYTWCENNKIKEKKI